jgi:CheY-like chemotaxis protein
MSKNILVADTPDADRRIAAILPGYDLVFVRTLDQAQQALARAHFGLVLIGVHFDESRMFELLRLVRTYEVNELTPVVCMLTSESRLSDVAIEGLDHAVKAMLANAFLNLNKFPDDEFGNARVRRIIDYLILIDGDMHGGFESVHHPR